MRVPARLQGEFLIHRQKVHQDTRRALETVSPRSVVVGKPRVLIVDDNLIVQTFVKFQLEALGCEVFVASDAETALKLYHPSLHLVILDLDLPDKPGFSIANYIRVREMSTDHHMPIIGHTSHVDEDVEYRCFTVGMNNVIEKLKTDQECYDLLRVWLPEFMQVN